MINRKLIVILSVLVSHFAFAQEVFEYFNGARMLGMGGAQIAVVNDETALLSNPAGMGKLRDFYGTIFDPELDFGVNLSDIYISSPFSSPFDPQNIATSLNADRNKYYHARFQIFPSYVIRNFGIGLFYRYQLDMRMNSAGTSVQTHYWEDVGLHLGYNLRFFDGRIKFGFAGKLISRIEVDRDIAYPGDISIGTNGSEGAAIGVDVGMNFALPWAWLPTLSIVGRDLGSTQFTAGKGLRYLPTTAPIPNAVTQDFDVAIAVFPLHESRGRSTFTIEMQKYLAATASGNTSRYLHIGYEYNISDVLFFRAGMNGNFWTAGAEFATEKLQFQFATYGEDIGQGSNVTEDRRFVLKFSSRF